MLHAPLLLGTRQPCGDGIDCEGRAAYAGTVNFSEEPLRREEVQRHAAMR